MANNVGTRITYQGGSFSAVPTVPQVHVIADWIENVSPVEFALIKRLGIGEQGQAGMNKAAQFRITRRGRMVEWMHDALIADSDTLGGAVGTTTTTEFTATTANVWRAGDIVLVDSEYLQVTGVSSTTITVGRAKFGSTAATHASGATVSRVTRASLEGGTPASGNTTNVSTDYNVTQIFEDHVSVSGTEEVVDHLGYTDPMDYYTFMKFQELLRDLNRTLYHGKLAAGDASTRRTMGGLPQFITSAKGSYVSSLSSEPLTEDAVADAMQSIRQSSGKLPNLLVTDLWGARKISSWAGPYVRTERTETTVGYTVNRIVTQFGELEVIHDIFNRAGYTWLLCEEDIGIYPLRPFFTQELAVTGDFKPRMVVGEYSFVVRNPSAHGLLYGYSTTA